MKNKQSSYSYSRSQADGKGKKGIYIYNITNYTPIQLNIRLI